MIKSLFAASAFLLFSNMVLGAEFALTPAEKRVIARYDELVVAKPEQEWPSFWNKSMVSHSEGVYFHFLDMLADALGLPLRCDDKKNYDEIINAVAQGEAHLSLGFVATEKRQETLLFSEPVVSNYNVKWFANTAAQEKSPDELHWVCIRGALSCDHIEALGYRTLTQADTAEKMIHMLSSGQADSAVVNFVVAYDYFKTVLPGEWQGEIEVMSQQTGTQASLIMGHVHAELMAIVNRYIDYAKAQGLLQPLNSDLQLLHNDLILHAIKQQYQRDVLRYTIRDDLHPLSYRDPETGNVVGYVHDIMDLLARKTGLKFQYVNLSGRTTREMLEQGEVELVPGKFVDVDLNGNVMATMPLFTLKWVQIQTKQPVDDHNLAILDRGNSLSGGYSEMQLNQSHSVYTDINRLLTDVSNGVVTHAYVPQSVVDVQLYFKKGEKFDVVNPNNPQMADTHIGIVMRDDSALLRSVLNAAIEVTTENEIDLARLNHHRIIAQYGFDKATATHIAAWVVGVTLLIILAGLMHTKQLRGSLLSARATEKRSYQQVEWLMKLLDNIPGMVVITDATGKPILSNKAFKTCLHACETNQCSNMLQPCFFLNSLGGSISDNDLTELHLTKDGCAVEDRYYRILRETVINPRDGDEYNITVYDDFTELKQQQQQLKESKLQAIHALKAREAFLAMISHELRTPLAAMIGLMELLSSKLKQKENQELMQNAQLSAERLKLLVNDILDFSKMEAEQLQLDMYRSNAFNELCPVIRTFESHAQFKKLQFVMDWQPTALCMAELDWHRVVQIINNLLNNAIKFTDQGYISVSVITAEQYLQLVVKDSGCGMTQDQLAHLFQPFAQGDRTITRRYGGSGLGMSIVQRLVVLMGGTIDVISDEGQGTTVTVKLPAAFFPVDKHECKPVFAADLRIAQWLAAWQVTIEDNVASDSASIALMVESDNVYPDVLLKQLSAYMPNATAAAHGVQFSGTVLVADDDPINRLLFQKQLSKLGLTTVIVNDGLEAIQTLQAQAHKIDVVITDCHMPNLDGYELTLKIKGDATLSHLPVIGCTAEDSRLVTEKIKQVGMDDIVYKPYTLNELSSILGKYFTSAKEEDSPLTLSWLGDYDAEEQLEMSQVVQAALTSDHRLLSADNSDLPALAHRIKGSAHALGISELANAAKACEGVSGQAAVLAKQHLLSEMEKVIQAVNRWMDNR